MYIYRKGGVPILHQVARESNADSIWFFWISVQAAQHTNTVSELSTAKGDDRQIVWQLAAVGRGGGNVQVIEKLL